MSSSESTAFDAIIVGAGQAGPPLAGRLTEAGQTVAVIERKLVGGTCVNYGCIPTKTLVASAYAAHLARRGADYGIGTGDVTVDMAKVKGRKDGIVTEDREGVESWLEGMKGCTLLRGHARFLDPHTLHEHPERPLVGSPVPLRGDGGAGEDEDAGPVCSLHGHLHFCFGVAVVVGGECAVVEAHAADAGEGEAAE